jgi:hypothetical protein
VRWGDPPHLDPRVLFWTEVGPAVSIIALRSALAVGVALGITFLASASTETDERSREQYRSETVRYNSKFTFTRIRYDTPYGSRRGGFRGFGGSAWNHDYPMADRNMQVMLNEFTAVSANTEGSNVYELEDRGIFENPILYISEPGTWGLTDEGAVNLREYLLKGGFLMFDDFEEDQWYNMAEQMAKALPEGQWVEIGPEHPIFDTFFYVENIYVPHPLVRVTPSYRVIFEDNDPEKRIMVLANHNSDLAEYWEYAAQGYFPVDPTNDAFRLGINYIVYGLTH